MVRRSEYKCDGKEPDGETAAESWAMALYTWHVT